MALLSFKPTAGDHARLTGALWTVGVLACAAVFGAHITSSPTGMLALSGVLLALAFAIRFPDAMCRLFERSMAILLLGYVAFGRGFAHLGISPIYVGEMGLAIGVLALVGLIERRRLVLPRSPLLVILAAYMVWGTFRTVPYLREYKADALRDAVLWGYGIIVFLLLPHLLDRERVEIAAERYGQWAFYVLPWLPVGLIIARLGGGSLIPSDYGEGLENFLKAGDVGVHLGGIAAYQLLQLGGTRAASTARSAFFGVAWLLTFAVVSATNRGGTLAALTAILIVALTTRGRIARQLAGAGLLAILILTVLISTDVSLYLGNGRSVSASQIVANVKSVAGGSNDESLDGTRRWRLDWWNDIISYTVHGPYFWTGKGFGINLAEDDGYAVDKSGALRSPHNAHMSVLARAGVPGLTIWVLLQLAFAATVLRARHLARESGDGRRARLLLWILAYWIAILLNASFDVYLEGPPGGFWYWSLLAAGIALSAPITAAARPDARRHAPGVEVEPLGEPTAAR